MTEDMTAAFTPLIDTDTGVIITAYGIPASQGSKRFVGVRGGRGIMVESSKKLPSWRQAVRDAALARIRCRCRPDCPDLLPGFPLDRPLFAGMVFTLPKPTTAPKRRRTWPQRMPDLSKLLRATEDPLTEVGVWRDDARVVEYRHLAKTYPGEHPDALTVPGVIIRIWSATEEEHGPT
jgi:hypothetical protein